MLRNSLPSLCVNLKQQSYQKATSCVLHSCLLQENPDYTPLVTSALVFLWWVEHMLGSLRKSVNEFDDVKLNIKYEGQREAETRGDVCDI